jgi:hypothetical protein
MEKVIKRPTSVLSAFILLILGTGLWAARAPTSVTGKFPIIGEIIPIELNAVYFVIFAPIAAMACAAAVWMVIANRSQERSTPMLLADRRSENRLVAVIFGAIVVLSVVLSLQYFLILAPEKLCATRPHFDFLWTNIPGPERITHCMSATADVNMHSPYYFEPQILQSWSQVLWPILTFLFLLGAWRAWTKDVAH